MDVGDKIIIPAQAAGFASLFGSIAKGAGDTLNLPEGMLNIGGNGLGFLLESHTDWDPVANSDGSFDALTLGDDIYVYAVQHASGIAACIASKNSTVPTGYTSDNSRKLGGFHFGRNRPMSERYNAAYVPTLGIVSGSCWDLKHRPMASPEGMAEFMPGWWGSLYELSIISGSWPNEVYGSRYGATPVRDTGGYTREDLYRGLLNAGMQKPSWEQWKIMAYGAPAGSDNNNDTAWTATSNTGPTTTGDVEKSVSCLGFVDCVGNLWEILEGNHDIGDYNGSATPYDWDASVVDVGKDSTHARGQVNHVHWRQCIAGGPFDHGQRCGAATLHTHSAPWSSNGTVGVRGVSASIRT